MVIIMDKRIIFMERKKQKKVKKKYLKQIKEENLQKNINNKYLKN